MTAKVVLAVALGFFVIPLAMLGGMTDKTYPSIKEWPSGAVGQGPHRPYVRQWRFNIFNFWYANSEDGVDPDDGEIWTDGVTLAPYSNTFPAWVPKFVKTYLWSAWRNNANNVKRPLRSDYNTPWTPA
jgi:hypothetical protein